MTASSKFFTLLVLSVGLLTLVIVVFTPNPIPLLRSGIVSSWLPHSSSRPSTNSASSKPLMSEGTDKALPTAESLPESGLGFVLALDIVEQFINAGVDLMNLQCWASSVGLDSVLEPSIQKHSDAHVLYFLVDYQQCQRFGDLVDIENWNRYSKERHFVPLSSMEEFLQKASRNVIYVDMTGSTVCPTRTTLSSSETYSFLQSNNFKIVRSVCISRRQWNGRLTQQQFRDLVFGDLDGQEKYTVVFSLWRAIRNGSNRNGDRILIQDSPCDYFPLDVMPYHAYVEKRGFFNKVPPIANLPKKHAKLDTTVLKESKLGLVPSKQVLDTADLYRTKCLSNKPYIAVMARTEKVNLKHQHEFTECAQKMLGYVKSGMELYNLTEKIFTSDLGDFGSTTLRNKDMATTFQKEIMVTLSINHIDDPATGCVVDHSKGPVRAAWTQNIIFAEARCIVLIGAGKFLLNVLNTHTALYRGNECFVFFDRYCTELGKAGFS